MEPFQGRDTTSLLLRRWPCEFSVV